MTLLPLMQYIFDTSWPLSAANVFMTAAKVWGPLSVSLIVWLVLSVWWVVLIGLVLTGTLLWIDPKFYEQIKWEAYETHAQHSQTNKWVRTNG